MDDPLDTISDRFDNVYRCIKDENVDIPSTSCAETVKMGRDVKLIRLLEDITNQVSQLSMFSTNELVSELSPDSLKFLLLPELLGELMLKINDDRVSELEMAKMYHIDYLKRLRDYQIIDYKITAFESQPNSGDSAGLSVTGTSLSREEKIRRFKEKSLLDQKIAEVIVYQNSTDDDLKREFWIQTLKLYAHNAVDELREITMELPFAKQRAESLKNGGVSEIIPTRSTRRFKPFILTRTDAQKKVFGLGYPSHPVLTVREWVDQAIKDGHLPSEAPNPVDLNRQPDPEIEAAEKDDAIDRDDEALRSDVDQLDDYRDDHRRGWGNTKNKG